MDIRDIFEKAWLALCLLAALDLLVIIVFAVVHRIRRDRNGKRRALEQTARHLFPALLSCSLLGYGTLCFLDDNASISAASPAFLMMFAMFLVFLSIILYFMIMFPVFLVRVLGKILGTAEDRSATKEISEQAITVQKQIEENKAKELELRKAKYRPVRCAYCGTMNSPRYSNCKNCGSPLENRDSRLLE